MKKYLILFLLIFLAGNLNSKPLPAKSVHVIIIDTDCAIDDMRAISLILSRPEMKVKAILLSDGTLSPIKVPSRSDLCCTNSIATAYLSPVVIQYRELALPGDNLTG
jgi:hypothetical protein